MKYLLLVLLMLLASCSPSPKFLPGTCLKGPRSRLLYINRVAEESTNSVFTNDRKIVYYMSVLLPNHEFLQGISSPFDERELELNNIIQVKCPKFKEE
jgi:hypothetical protein